MKDIGDTVLARTCTVLVPIDVGAGSGTDLRIEVEAPTEVLATEQPVEIRDKDGTVIHRATIRPTTPTDEGTRACIEITTITPDHAGLHPYKAYLPPVSVAGMAYAGIEVEFSLEVVAHTVDVTVFEVPQAVEKGAEFSVTIGASCCAHCDLTGWTVSVCDAEGGEVAASTIGGGIWPGTSGLRYATAMLAAPVANDKATWEATVAPPDGHDFPHSAGRRRFGLNVTEAADARLHVEAVASDTGAPLAGLKVVAGPFRTMTDAEGRAELAVSPGQHRVFVSGKTYIPHREDCLVVDETKLRVSLDPDLGPTDQMVWG